MSIERNWRLSPLTAESAMATGGESHPSMIERVVSSLSRSAGVCALVMAVSAIGATVLF